ncbi:MAG: GGDEF domain-containing protein, partial [Ilumatobacter sp.]
ALLLDRALVRQGAASSDGPAADARQALDLLKRAGRIDHAALAASATAGLVFRTGDIETAVEDTVEAMLLLDGLDGSTFAARAANAVAGVFVQLAAFEFSYRYSMRALELLGDDDGPMRDIIYASHAHIVIESHHAGVTPPLDTVRACINWLESESHDEVSRRVSGPGLTAELVNLEQPARLGSVNVDESAVEIAAPRLACWFRLVAATIRHARGEHQAAEQLLDVAIPDLLDVRDDHRLVRAYRLRSEVRTAVGDFCSALDDARRRCDLLRSWHIEQIGRLAVQISQRTELERTRELLENRATTLAENLDVDPLTAVGSRHLLDATLADIARDPGGRAAVVLFDLDHFKHVNDSYGHVAGDTVLQRVGSVLRNVSRSEDVIARFGGEEFVAVLIGTSIGDATSYAEKVRHLVEAIDWRDVAPELDVRVSAGVAEGTRPEIHDTLRRADHALYEAKHRGRNRTVAAPPRAEDETR